MTARRPAKLPFTGLQLVAIAEREIGTVERPVNRTKYGVAFGQDGLFWCAVFVWWCFQQLGIDLKKLLGIGAAVASTNDLDRAMAAEGWEPVPASRMRAGDFAFYDLGVTAPGDPPNDDDHVEIVTRRPILRRFKAIGGNTSPDKHGSQRNGGGVYPRTRSTQLVRRAYRPPYSSAADLATMPATRRAARPKATKKKLATRAGAALLVAGAATGGGLALTGPDAPTKSGTAGTSTATPSVTATPAPSASKPPRATPKDPVLTRTLRYTKGKKPMRGRDVEAVQRLVGLKGRAVDGEYGPGTARAVKKWQAAHLKPNGAFGPSSAIAAGWIVP